MLPSLPQDKANHLLYGALVGLLAYALARALTAPYAAWLPWGAATLVGAAKEAADHLGNLRAARAGMPTPHGVEWADFAATAAGGALITLTALL